MASKRYFVPTFNRPGISKILHVTARDGVARNLLSGDLLSVSNVSDCTNSDYTTFSNASPTGFSVTSDGTGSHNAGTADEIPFVSGDKIRVSFDLTLNSGTAPSYNLRHEIGGAGRTSEGVQTAVEGSNVFTFTLTATEDGVLDFLNSSTATDYSVANLQVQRIIPEVTNTNIEVVKDGQIRVPKFNATSSKINCGSYNDLTGDITILAWVKAYSQGEGTNGVILDNTQFVLRTGGTYRVYLYNDSSTFIFTDPNVIERNGYTFIAVVRKSSGHCDLWVNDQQLKDQALPGTPVAGTTNLAIGNNNLLTRTWDGAIPEVIVLSGLLTAAEISQYFSSTKHLYGK